jgi:FkbM family methyltransferase
VKLSNLAWLPDDETDSVMLNTGINYQSFKYHKALIYTKKRRTAVDIGSHCGLWAVQMAKHFEKVVCFEPLPVHIECWKKNVSNCVLHEVALGDRESRCSIEVVPGASGRSHIKDGTDFRVMRLDDFHLEDVDFIKADVEGYELLALRGGEETIKRCKPVVIVEQKPGHATRLGLPEKGAVGYLKTLGYSLKEEMMGDYVMVHEPAV